MLEKEFIVKKTDTAKALGSGGLDVLASPALVAYMENVAFLHLEDECELGFTSVGSAFDLEHLKPSLVGETIQIKILSKERDDRRVDFLLEAYCKSVLIGKAKHQRFIVSKEKFLSKLKP